MPPTPTIRPIADAELPEAGRVLAAAFEGDPLWTWIAPQRRWLDRAARWFTAEARTRLAAGAEILVDDDLRGVAIWGPPGRWVDDREYGRRMTVPSMRMFAERMLRARSLDELLKGVHPREPHWYLAYLVTHPDHQGTGVGGALVRTVTDRCDAEGLPAYLESSKEANLAFYSRLGFEDQGAVAPPGGPSMWPMWRPPRP